MPLPVTDKAGCQHSPMHTGDEQSALERTHMAAGADNKPTVSDDQEIERNWKEFDRIFAGDRNFQKVKRILAAQSVRRSLERNKESAVHMPAEVMPEQRALYSKGQRRSPPLDSGREDIEHVAVTLDYSILERHSKLGQFLFADVCNTVFAVATGADAV